jgi:GNAT superfamily N-acetyltransferase
MTSNTALEVRPLQESDRDDWTALWTAYLNFYETSVPADTFATYFDRLLGADPQDFNGLVAVIDGKLVGLNHYLYHRHGWKVENVCYLQDLYADPSVRGMCVGRALIEAVYAAANANGTPSVYWLTQEENTEARKLYDRVAQVTDFIKYGRVAA